MPNKASKTKVSQAVSATVAPEVTPGTFLSLTGNKVSAKVTVAPAMTARQHECYDMGYALGCADAEQEQSIIDALVACGSNADRVFLRHGYCAGYVSAPRIIRKREVWPTAEQAQQRFSYLARIHSPETSRKVASNKRKPGGGRKTKTTATVKKGEASDAKNVTQALAYIKAAQKTHADDSDILQVLADLAKILRMK
jgi:hypothetical protein